MSLTDEQKKLRATGLGASELATLVGIGHGSLVELWASKVNPSTEPEDENLPADLGNLLESPVSDLYARRTATFIAPTTTFRHPEHELILATPDRAVFGTMEALQAARALGTNDLGQLTSRAAFTHSSKLLEVKTHAARLKHEYGSDGSGVVPEYVAVQATVQMACTGLRLVDVAVLFRGDFGVSMQIHHVVWNEGLFGWLVEEASRFWRDHVVTKKPPTPDGTDRYDEALSRMFPADRTPPVVADDDDERLMLDFAKFRAVEHRAEKLKKAAAQTLKARIGEASGLTSASLGRLSWKRTKDSTEIDWQAAAQNALTLGGIVLDGLKRLRADEAMPSPESLAELEQRLKAIVPDATKVKQGYRRLLLTPAKGGPADVELARLEIALDALGDGV